jgi:hypothetical protein
MMTKDNEAYAYFSLAEFTEDPAEITKRVGVEPTEFWKKGDVNPKTNLERRFNRWSLYSRLSRESELEDHILDVLDQLDNNKEAFKAIINEQGWAMLQLVGYFHTYYPGFSLESKIINRISEYNLAMDCDFYYLYSDEREDS